MNTPIQLDLRRDLPKVRAALDELVSATEGCSYTVPCAIGVMMRPEQREALARRPGPMESADTASIAWLVDEGLVTMPDEQVHDAKRLQRSFDTISRREKLPVILAELEAKYASEQAAS